MHSNPVTFNPKLSIHVSSHGTEGVSLALVQEILGARCVFTRFDIQLVLSRSRKQCKLPFLDDVDLRNLPQFLLRTPMV
jgi:hypothetical protein